MEARKNSTKLSGKSPAKLGGTPLLIIEDTETYGTFNEGQYLKTLLKQGTLIQSTGNSN